ARHMAMFLMKTRVAWRDVRSYPKADIRSAKTNVSFVPIADMSRFTRSPHRQSRLQGGLGPFYFF
ncbi:MAG: hypothetical protein WCB52_19550, partial [Pseudolabrys sp.]